MKKEYLIHAIENSKYLVALGGLNLIREMGMTHYHDRDEAYRIEKKYGCSPEELFSAQCFATDTERFYKYYKDDILTKDAEPGPAFFALSRLEKVVKLKCLITREIYNLPRRAGCKNVIDLHGNIYDHNHCPRCGKEFSLDYIKGAKKVPVCDNCNIPIHPGVSLLGEMVDNHVMSKAAEEVAKADVLLVAGMNLKSALCQECLQYFNGTRLILVNLEEHYLDSVADMIYYENLEDFLPKIAGML